MTFWIIALFSYIGIMGATVLVIHLIENSYKREYTPEIFKSVDNRNLWTMYCFLFPPLGLVMVFGYLIPRYRKICFIRNKYIERLKELCNKDKTLVYAEEYKEMNIKGRYNMFTPILAKFRK